MYKDLFQPSFNVTQDFKEVRVIYLWKTKNNLSKIFSCYMTSFAQEKNSQQAS